MKPYYEDKWVKIFHGNCREVLPVLQEPVCPDCSSSEWRDNPLDNSDFICHDCGGFYNKFQVDLLLADPPYGINKAKWDKVMPIEWLGNCLPLVKNTGAVYIFGESLSLSRLQVFYEDKGIKWNTRAVWVYEEGLRSAAQWVSKHEDCLIYFNSEHKAHIPQEPSLCKDPRWGNDRYLCNVWKVNRILGNHGERLAHPTQKPEELIELIIMASSAVDNVILDPFLGSGTTCYCAKKLNRYSIGIEIEEEYCEIAAKRCQQEAFKFDLPTKSTEKQTELSI